MYPAIATPPNEAMTAESTTRARRIIPSFCLGALNPGATLLKPSPPLASGPRIRCTQYDEWARLLILAIGALGGFAPSGVSPLFPLAFLKIAVTSSSAVRVYSPLWPQQSEN